MTGSGLNAMFMNPAKKVEDERLLLFATLNRPF